ncbi:hypothetical protein ACFO1B_19055 [Dactylosporangium siamense]|uniref:Uncharacterized protein n=1 Tax=Dactylosporangium siamense TaxID=685454 RepID=A0A919PFP6_9ACTN|nr:hypothetical protein [Dactylosporangium siamense]GIG43981.1 hypothetical protein Dsi01nite_020220 [Dactylosporangium siamense]
MRDEPLNEIAELLRPPDGIGARIVGVELSSSALVAEVDGRIAGGRRTVKAEWRLKRDEFTSARRRGAE